MLGYTLWACRFPKPSRFAPFDFESGGSWVAALDEAGFDPATPALVRHDRANPASDTGGDPADDGEVADLAPAATCAATFIVRWGAADAADCGLVAMTAQIKEARRAPWLSTFTPVQFARLARESGLLDATVISPRALNDRYFAGALTLYGQAAASRPLSHRRSSRRHTQSWPPHNAGAASPGHEPAPRALTLARWHDRAACGTRDWPRPSEDASSRERRAVIRALAKERGIAVVTEGRIAQDVVVWYQAAARGS